jgi:D-serine dehydratase
MTPENLQSVMDSEVDRTCKGMPHHVGRMLLADIGRQGWNVLREDLPLPVAVIRSEVLEQNSRWMRAFLARTGVQIAPHGKTTMCPQLFLRQITDGAWGMTCATPAQLQVYRTFGVRRVLLANQLVGRQAVAFVCREIVRDPHFEFYTIADSVAAISNLAEMASHETGGRRLRILVEIGQAGARTGVRTIAEALELARAIAAQPALALAGVASYEGVVSGSTDDILEANVSRMLEFQSAFALEAAQAGLFSSEGAVLLTAGGSQFPDMAADRLKKIDIGRPTEVVLRSGCYLIHDDGHYAHALQRMSLRSPSMTPFEQGLSPALELWAYFQSRPEPSLGFATFGKRDAGHDLGFPQPLRWFRPGWHSQPQPLASNHRVMRLSDQHAHLELPSDTPLRVGDMIGFGISHPCTTFDKWTILPVVNQHYDVIDALRTYF